MSARQISVLVPSQIAAPFLPASPCGQPGEICIDVPKGGNSMRFSSASIQKSIDRCREEMDKCDALSPACSVACAQTNHRADPPDSHVSSGEDDSQE